MGRYKLDEIQKLLAGQPAGFGPAGARRFAGVENIQINRQIDGLGSVAGPGQGLFGCCFNTNLGKASGANMADT
jgi:hypothetical protein